MRERRKWYRRLLFWYYAVVKRRAGRGGQPRPTAVYFRYTQKRFTAEEIFFADNGNSLQLVGKFMAENWYLVIAASGLTTLLVLGLRPQDTPRRVS